MPHELDGQQTLVLGFGASQAGPGALGAWAELAAAFPRSVRTGCSSAGEIHQQQVHDDSLSVVVARFEHTQLKRACTPIEGPADSLAAGQRLGRRLATEDLRAVFVLSEGLQVNGSSLVAGLREVLPPEVCITGGLAGDGCRFGHTWVVNDDESHAAHVVAIGLYGDRLRIGHGCDGGWDDFGPERRITRAQGNVLHELDGQPALDLYKHYLGNRAAGLPGTALLFPLAVRRSPGDPQPLVRTILAIDEAQRSMTFAGDIPQGGVARLMRSNTDRLIDSAGAAAQQALRAVGDRRALLLTVSCVGRRLVLGERTEEEVEAVLDLAAPGSAQVGFYSYGEISPTLDGGLSDLHNQTMTITALAED